MPDKQLILQTNWRYYYSDILWGVMLSPVLIGLFILYYTYYKIRVQTYILYDDRIVDRKTGLSFFVDDIINTRITTSKTGFIKSVHNLELHTEKDILVLKGIEKASDIQEVINELITLKKEIKDANKTRERVQVKQDPGSLERLNDLAGLLQEGLISYEDYLQERKKFEDS
jgi:hypothetical protein